MIKLMLVAGENSNSLAEFLQQRGTFVVDFLYRDLYSNSQELLNSVIRVDKLVYVYQSREMDNLGGMFIRQEMQVLKSMYEDNKFFKASEVILLCSDDQGGNEIQEYFTVVMKDCEVEKYSIKVLDSIGSFSSIYQNLIGVSLTANFDNQYRNLYRRSKGDDARMAYDPVDSSQMMIEPFNYDNLNSFKERQALMQQIESSEQLIDSEDKRRETFNKLSMPQVALEKNRKSVFIVTGDQKAGKSYWATQIANSAVSQNKESVLLLDFSKHQRVSKCIRENELIMTEVDPFDLLNGKIANKDHGVVCCVGGCDFTMTYLKEISELLEQFDVVVTAVEKSDVAVVAEMFEIRKIYCIGVVYQYVENVLEISRILTGNKILVLNQQGLEKVEITADQIKLQHSDTTVIKPFRFTTFNNVWLYSKLSKIGGEY